MQVFSSEQVLKDSSNSTVQFSVCERAAARHSMGASGLKYYHPNSKVSAAQSPSHVGPSEMGVVSVDALNHRPLCWLVTTHLVVRESFVEAALNTTQQ